MESPELENCGELQPEVSVEGVADVPRSPRFDRHVVKQVSCWRCQLADDSETW